MNDRIFAGIYPCGIVYADRKVERHGDYKRLAFLSYATLELEIEPDCPAKLATEITADAAKIQARRGELFSTSATGATVLLGSACTGEPVKVGRAEFDRHVTRLKAIPDGFKTVGSYIQTKFFAGGCEVARRSQDGFGVVYETIRA